MFRMRRFLPLIGLLLFLVAFVSILVLAGQGRGFWGFLEAIPYGDKLGHVGLVGTLAFLLNLTLRNRRFGGRFHRIQIGSGLVAIIMTVEEISQVLLPTRNADLLDWLANLTGAALAQAASSALASPRRAGGTNQPRSEE